MVGDDGQTNTKRSVKRRKRDDGGALKSACGDTVSDNMDGDEHGNHKSSGKDELVQSLVDKMRSSCSCSSPLTDHIDVVTVRSEMSKLTIPLLKGVCREFKLRVMGKKGELVERIVNNYERMLAGIVLHTRLKRALAVEWMSLHGPALFDKKSCVNDMDLMGEDVVDIPLDQFFSFADSGFKYAFDIATFGSLIVDGCDRKRIINPYTRDPLTVDVIRDYKQLLVLSALLGRNYRLIHIDDANASAAPQAQSSAAEHTQATGTVINRTVVNGTVDVDITMTEEDIDNEIGGVMYVVDSYGHYTDPAWVTGMSIFSLKEFVNDMVEIFNYRANLTRHAMTRIVSPSGVLVSNPGMLRHLLRTINNIATIKQIALEVMKKLVLSGVEQGDRDLGTLYMLTALTLHAEGARTAMPWLYESTL